MSDLHIEFQAMQLPDPDSYDVAILAGDIHTQARSAAWVARHFSKPVILVAGNHDYYKCSLDRALQRLRLHAPSGKHVHFLKRQTKVIGNVLFIGCPSTRGR
ncbi:hypothetical protein PPUN110474_09890 [Pseudomonas putida]|nr:hypothetical protein PPUN110474_09890 [Pseudomonas putida]